MRHRHCLRSMWYSIRERQSIITPFKNSVPDLPTLQQGTPRVPRAGTSDAPLFLSLQCKQGRFMPRRKRPCACIYKGLRFSNQVYCKKEGRESLFAEMGSEEMRTSERQTTEWGTEIVALSCLWRRIIKRSYIKKKRNSQGLGKYFATKATPACISPILTQSQSCAVPPVPAQRDHRSQYTYRPVSTLEQAAPAQAACASCFISPPPTWYRCELSLREGRGTLASHQAQKGEDTPSPRVLLFQVHCAHL